MSVGYNPKNENTMNQSLRVQEISLSGSDGNLYVISGGNLYVRILEPVEKIFLARCKVDSSNLTTEFAQSSLSIVDSSALTAGGDEKYIKIAGLSALASGDCLVVKYSVLEHL
jgi:hypothetical protein